MITTVYGYPIYMAQVRDSLKMLDEVYLNISKVGNVSVWDSECLTTSTISDENRFNSEYVKNEVLHHATEMMKQLHSDMTLTIKMCETDNCTMCDDIWMNVYNKGHYQITHMHHSDQPGSKIPTVSFSYFAKYDQNKDATFIFVNPKSSYPKEVTMNVKEGDILLFPSFMLHRVEKQMTDGPRITISGNLFEQLKE